MEWALVKTLLSLFLVIGAMFGVLFLMKKFMTGFRSQNGAVVDIELLGKRMIQPKFTSLLLKLLEKLLSLELPTMECSC
jgi:hypothetical protein